MTQQVGDILHFLDNEMISCEYLAEDRIVYALFNNGEMEVRCFFLFGTPGKILSYSICSEPVDIHYLDEVERNLSKINKSLESGYFYFDVDIQCIVYYNDYFNTDEKGENNLERFCRWTYEVFLHYEEELFAVS